MLPVEGIFFKIIFLCADSNLGVRCFIPAFHKFATFEKAK
jgi:hypothetical protein